MFRSLDHCYRFFYYLFRRRNAICDSTYVFHNTQLDPRRSMAHGTESITYTKHIAKQTQWKMTTHTNRARTKRTKASVKLIHLKPLAISKHAWLSTVMKLEYRQMSQTQQGCITNRDALPDKNPASFPS